MKRTVFFLIAAMISISCSRSIPATRASYDWEYIPQRTPISPKIQQAIQRYVQATRGWSRDSYIIQWEAVQDFPNNYSVTHIFDLEAMPMYTGGRNSFSAEYDPCSDSIVRELLYQ